MITSTQITNIEIFAFIAVLVFELLSRRFLFTNIKDKNSWVNYCKIINRIQSFQHTFETRKRSFISDFSICMAVP